MRSLLCLCALALTFAACGEDTPVDNRPRFVEQDRLDNPIVPLEHVDASVQTEAISAMRTIADRIKIKALTATDKAAFYRSMSGTLNSTKLAQIGITEAQLQGSFYKASDYSLSIVGNQLTITAAQIGTRGRVEPQTFTLP